MSRLRRSESVSGGGFPSGERNGGRRGLRGSCRRRRGRQQRVREKGLTRLWGGEGELGGERRSGGEGEEAWTIERISFGSDLTKKKSLRKTYISLQQVL